MDARPGLEPGFPELETGVLPLDEPATRPSELEVCRESIGERLADDFFAEAVHTTRDVGDVGFEENCMDILVEKGRPLVSLRELAAEIDRASGEFAVAVDEDVVETTAPLVFDRPGFAFDLEGLPDAHETPDSDWCGDVHETTPVGGEIMFCVRASIIEISVGGR